MPATFGNDPLCHKGPTCGMICCAYMDFLVIDIKDGADVANVEWIWRSFKSVFTDSDVFSLDMPREMDLDKKALMIGAAMHVVWALTRSIRIME